MTRDKVYEVFARKSHQEPLMHVGSLNASDDELAKVYAWTMYDEENWVEMCVVPRDSVVQVSHERKIPLWGN